MFCTHHFSFLEYCFDFFFPLSVQILNISQILAQIRAFLGTYKARCDLLSVTNRMPAASLSLSNFPAKPLSWPILIRNIQGRKV